MNRIIWTRAHEKTTATIGLFLYTPIDTNVRSLPVIPINTFSSMFGLDLSALLWYAHWCK